MRFQVRLKPERPASCCSRAWRPSLSCAFKSASMVLQSSICWPHCCWMAAWNSLKAPRKPLYFLTFENKMMSKSIVFFLISIVTAPYHHKYHRTSAIHSPVDPHHLHYSSTLLAPSYGTPCDALEYRTWLRYPIYAVYSLYIWNIGTTVVAEKTRWSPIAL